jgi:hypothetical protein
VCYHSWRREAIPNIEREAETMAITIILRNDIDEAGGRPLLSDRRVIPAGTEAEVVDIIIDAGTRDVKFICTFDYQDIGLVVVSVDDVDEKF